MTSAPDLLGWLRDPPSHLGLRMATDDGGWRRVGYDELALQVRRAATELRGLGLRRGDVVSIVVGSTDRFVVALFGTLLAGGVPSPAAPPQPLQDRAVYLDRLAGVLGSAEAAIVVADPAIHDLVTEALSRTPHPGRLVDLAGDADPDDGDRPAEGLALVQFTSGSSGRQRGIPISADALAAQIGLLASWLRIGPEDVIGGWLPMHHDMGLIGCCLTPIVLGIDLLSLKPEQFVGDPARWLSMFGHHGATMSATPNFGLAYTIRRVGPDALQGMDLSPLRALIVGAERVDPLVLQRFVDHLAPFGLDPRSLLPAYGLAEATLAVSGRTGRDLRLVRPAWSQMQMGEPVVVEERISLGEGDVADGAQWLTSCGAALGGLAVEVVAPDGRPVPPGALGEIRVEGRSVAASYLHPGDGGSARFVDGGLVTGDSGFVDDGELFVVGRIGDSVKVRGRQVFAEDLEAKLAAEIGLPAHRVAVVLGRDEAGEQVGLAVEAELDEGVRVAAQRCLRRETGIASPWVACVARGVIPRTSSGKVRRRALWQMYAEGELASSAQDDLDS